MCFRKGSFCCISVALDLTTGLLLGDILKVNQTSPPPPAGGRPEAHSSIGNLKKPGEKNPSASGCYCAEKTLPLTPRSKELYLATLNCTSEANMLFNPSRVIWMESNGAVCVCTLCQLLGLISAGALTSFLRVIKRVQRVNVISL